MWLLASDWLATSDITCPKMVHQYHKFMGGVDLNDMLLSYYRIKLRSNKWYMPIFYYLMKISVTNGRLLYRRQSKQVQTEAKHMSLLQFQAEVASGLTRAAKLPCVLVTKRGRPSSSPKPLKKPRTCATVAIPWNDVRYDCYDHFPIYDDKQHRCRHCSCGYTHLQCVKCKLFLCVNKSRNCFRQFHVSL